MIAKINPSFEGYRSFPIYQNQARGGQYEENITKCKTKENEKNQKKGR